MDMRTQCDLSLDPTFAHDDHKGADPDRDTDPGTDPGTDPDLSKLGDADLIKMSLRLILLDTRAPASAKASAAKTLGEITGMVGRNAPPPDNGDRDQTEMTEDEIRAELARSG
jgi:hypothetical protein